MKVGELWFLGLIGKEERFEGDRPQMRCARLREVLLKLKVEWEGVEVGELVLLLSEIKAREGELGELIEWEVDVVDGVDDELSKGESELLRWNRMDDILIWNEFNLMKDWVFLR